MRTVVSDTHAITMRSDVTLGSVLKKRGRMRQAGRQLKRVGWQARPRREGKGGRGGRVNKVVSE